MKNNNNLGFKFYRFILPLLIFFSIGIILFSAYWAEQRSLQQSTNHMQRTLDFQAQTLKTSMDKYAVMTALIARRLDVVSLLRGASGPAKEINYQISIIAGMSGVSDIWLVNSQGQIVAANRGQRLGRFIGEQADFVMGMQGNLGRSSLSTPQGERFYRFTSPVRKSAEILGVVMVQVNLEFVEQVWALLEDKIAATDARFQILLSNQPSWRLEYLSIDAESMMLSKTPLDNNDIGPFPNNQLIQRDLETDEGVLIASRYIPLLDWYLHIVMPYKPIAQQRFLVGAVTSLVLGLMILASCFWVERLQRQYKEQRLQHAFALRLERRVKQRTAELENTNEQLQEEVVERKLAETQLREAQDELVQAAKMAGIGQMSTALAHEYNQPLAALHSYSENAVTFIQQNRPKEAIDNLERIKLLIAKMGDLTKTLRSFAYKSENKLTQVSLQQVMDEVLILLSPQAKNQGITLQFLAPENPVIVQADNVRLSQIVVNLVTNAMDAVANTRNKQVDISWGNTEDQVFIKIKDTGPGIAQENRQSLFTPFFTTKPSGEGLGMGLFIVMNIIKDYGGNISLIDEVGYGAVFDIRLPNKE